MNEPGQVGRRRFFLLLAPLLFASIAIPTTRSDAADDRGPSAAQVAEGLRTVQDIAADVAAAGSDGEKAQKIDGGIEAVWSKIEDVVRGNDKDAYISFEDNFETLAAAAKAGDEALTASHLFHSTRADLLRRLGRRSEAADAYRRARALAPTTAEQRFLDRRLAETTARPA